MDHKNVLAALGKLFLAKGSKLSKASNKLRAAGDSAKADAHEEVSEAWLEAGEDCLLFKEIDSEDAALSIIERLIAIETKGE